MRQRAFRQGLGERTGIQGTGQMQELSPSPLPSLAIKEFNDSGRPHRDGQSAGGEAGPL